MSKKAGKDDKPRPRNWAKWDACPLWDNIGKNKKKKGKSSSKSACSLPDRGLPADVARCTNGDCAVKGSCTRWTTRNQDHARVFFHGPLKTYGCELFINDGTYILPQND